MTKVSEAMKLLFDVSNSIDFFSSGKQAEENGIDESVAKANNKLYGALLIVDKQLKMLGQYDEH